MLHNYQLSTIHYQLQRCLRKKQGKKVISSPTIVGTTEAASLLNISSPRLRQLLQQGRVIGAYKKEGSKFWCIPLKNGMPQIESRNWGPKGTWRKRPRTVDNLIYVNRGFIASNASSGTFKAPITVNQGTKSSSGHEVKVGDLLKLVYRPYAPLTCGATLWLEVAPEVPITTKTFSTIRESQQIYELEKELKKKKKKVS